MADFEFEHGPYPDDWGEHERHFWDGVPNTFSELHSEVEWGRMQDSFQAGWLEANIDPDQRAAAREDFYEEAGLDPSSFDWQEFRDYLEAIGYLD